MKIKEKIQDNVAVLSIAGKLMGGPDTQELHKYVSELVANDIVNVVIDLSKVKWMNSSGLGVLMASFATVLKKGGFLKLCGVTEKVQSLLMITQMITFFETFDTVEKAVASFKDDE